VWVLPVFVTISSQVQSPPKKDLIFKIKADQLFGTQCVASEFGKKKLASFFACNFHTGLYYYVAEALSSLLHLLEHFLLFLCHISDECCDSASPAFTF